MGKTRLGAMAATTAKGRVIVVTSRLPVASQWREELPNTEVYIINTAAKLDAECELLIIDEAHRASAPSFSKVFNIRYEKLLCLTATLPREEERAKVITDRAPIVYSKSIDEAPEVSAPYRVINLGVPMSAKSRARYKVFDLMFKSANIELARVFRRTNYPSIFEMARQESKSKDSPYFHPSKRYWSGMTMRKNMLYTAPEKFEAVKQILRAFPQKKWIIYTKSIDFATSLREQIGGLLYHSNMSAKEREYTLEQFKSQKLITSVEALNEGLNIPDADGAICVSASSTELVQIQSLGRILRQKEGKQALYFNLYMEDSQEEKWVRAKSLKLKNVEWFKLSQIHKV